LLARWGELPAERQGRLFLLMWANAVITVVLEPASLMVTLIAARRVWQHRHVGLRRAMRAGASPALAAVVSLNLAHQAARVVVIRVAERSTGVSGTTPDA
jgi:uncharacterized membrane protein YhiD involved in acid resistance